MRIGIYDINDCSSLSFSERIDVYKKCGYTSLGVYLDDGYMCNGEKYIDIIEKAREKGLKVNQVHVDYKISNMICKDSNEYFDYVEKKLNECVSLKIPYMVLHASKGNETIRISDKNINRLRELMRKYINENVYLCFENVRNNTNLEIIMNAKINNVKMCYDLGHAHCYDDEERLLDKNIDNIVCTHLHNNYGKDDHNSLNDGEIDCCKMISKINKINNIDNCLEVFPGRDTNLSKEQFVEFVKNNYDVYHRIVAVLE